MQIKITLQDRSNGQVRVIFEPSLASIIQSRIKWKDKEMSPAENYAFVMANAVKDASKKLDDYDPNRIITPGEF